MKGVPLNEELYNYILDTFVEEDDVLRSVVKQAEEKNFPLIHVSPENGRFLQMLIRMIKAKKVLEIGTLTGYSAIWMARGLPKSGKLTTLEYEEAHAKAAKENFKKAGLNKKIKIMVGKAADSLKKLKGKKFDFAFIDADKVSYPLYLEKVLKMMKKGGIIAVDNTLRDGEIISKTPDEAILAMRKLNENMAKNPKLLSLLIPISDGLTVGLVV
jgi:predicted O-methyltransferase YrrM